MKKYSSVTGLQMSFLSEELFDLITIVKDKELFIEIDRSNSNITEYSPSSYH
jgi:hypothetical protein